MEYGAHEPPPLDPDMMSLQAVKLEADSRMALLIRVIGDTFMNSSTVVETGLSSLLMESGSQDSWDMVSSFDAIGERYFRWLFKRQLDALSDDKGFQPFLANLELFRDAYYRRSPQPTTSDKQYESTRELIRSGVGTFTQHMVVFLHRLEEAAEHQYQLGPKEIARIALDSGHLLLSLAKLPLGQLERYVAMLTAHPDTMHFVARLNTSGDGQFRASLHPALLGRTRVTDILDNTALHVHRRHQGCAAAVNLESRNTIADLWQLSVRGLIRAGCWGDEAKMLLPPDADD